MRASARRRCGRRALACTAAVLATAVAACTSSDPAANPASDPVATPASSAPGDVFGHVMPPVKVPLPAPRSKALHGVTYTVHQIAPNGALATSDPRTVTLVALRERDDDQPACGQVAPSARLVSENARTVVVATFGYTAPERLRSHVLACSYISTNVGKQPAVSIGYAHLRVRLHAPLGRRRLVDADTGDLIGVLRAAPVPVPRYLPHGYRPTTTLGYTADSGYLSLRQFHQGANIIEIRGRSATAWGLTGHVVSRLSVHGRDAVVVNESYERCVVWTDPPGVLREVCCLAPRKHLLSAGTLTKIATSAG